MLSSLLRRASEKPSRAGRCELPTQTEGGMAANCLRPKAGPLGQHHQPAQGKIFFSLIVPAPYFAPPFALTPQTH